MRRTLIAIGAAGICLAAAAPAWATSPGGNGRIAYVASDGGIHSILPTGDDDQQLTHYGSEPDWSSNGQRIAFIASDSQTNQSQIYSMAAGGSDVRRLTARRSGAFLPSWSPNGRRIVFLTGAGIVSMRSDGSHPRVLSHRGNEPSYSPDGRWIEFLVGRTATHRPSIWLMRPNGTDQHRLLLLGSDGGYFSDYSPDGRHVIFVRWGYYSARSFFARADGTHIHALPCVPRSAFYTTTVSYSPDGRWLLGQVPVSTVDPRVVDYYRLIRFPLGPCLNGTLRAHQVIGRTEGAPSWQALP